MPYPGIPPSKTKDMESCVAQVMSDPKIRSKYPDPKKRKSHAIAICHNSIMGKKDKALEDSTKLDSETLKGGEKIMASISKDLKKADEEVKVEEVVEVAPEEKPAVEGEEAVVEPVKEEKPAEEAPAAVEAVSKGEPAEEVKPEEVKPEEAKPEEAVAEEVAEEVLPKPADVPAEEIVVEKAIKKPKKEEEEGEDHQCASLSDALEMALKSDDAKELKSAIRKALTYLRKGKAEKVEESHEEVVEKVVETKAVKPTEDLAEPLSKIADSIQKVTDQVDEISKKLDSVDERLVKIEEQPLPSKVVSPVVVSKVESVSPSQEELNKVNQELNDLEEMKKNYLDRYQKEKKWERAFELLRERERLMAKA